MRSGSLGTIFSSIGYPIQRIEGGYKSYRSFIVNTLENLPTIPFLTLSGHTGCGKSDLLQGLDNVIDLEAMANHYGSVFGDVSGEQPLQKEFQNRLVHAILALDLSRGVFVEAESKRIGKIMLPNTLHIQMEKGLKIEITAPLEQRIERIMRMYDAMSGDFFKERMEKISPYIRREDKLDVLGAFEQGNLEKVSEILLVRYYDHVYKGGRDADVVIHNDNPTYTLERLKEIQKGHIV
jgi:tRNA 2-selenouridine synthase